MTDFIMSNGDDMQPVPANVKHAAQIMAALGYRIVAVDIDPDSDPTVTVVSNAEARDLIVEDLLHEMAHLQARNDQLEYLVSVALEQYLNPLKNTARFNYEFGKYYRGQVP